MIRPLPGDDIIDSRDVIAAIEELESEEDRDEFEDEELESLKSLAEEGEQAEDWIHGETLIADAHFEDYAEQLADDIGAIDSDAGWPLGHIDWEAAADALKMDYFSVEFEGIEYWLR